MCLCAVKTTTGIALVFRIRIAGQAGGRAVNLAIRQIVLDFLGDRSLHSIVRGSIPIYALNLEPVRFRLCSERRAGLRKEALRGRRPATGGAPPLFPTVIRGDAHHLPPGLALRDGSRRALIQSRVNWDFVGANLSPSSTKIRLEYTKK